MGAHGACKCSLLTTVQICVQVKIGARYLSCLLDIYVNCCQCFLIVLCNVIKYDGRCNEWFELNTTPEIFHKNLKNEVINVSYQQYGFNLCMCYLNSLICFTELQQKIAFGGGFAFTWREPESTAIIHGIQRPSELSQIRVNMGDLCLYVIQIWERQCGIIQTEMH